MARVLQFLLFAFLLFVGGTIAAFVLLPWWQALIVVVVIIFAIVYGTQYVIRSAWRQIGSTIAKELEKRSAVLRGAQAEVHEVLLAEAPPKGPDDDDEDEDEEDAAEGSKAYYQVDVTVRPVPAAGRGAGTWTAGDLHLVAFNAAPPKFDVLGGGDDEEEDSYEPLNVQVAQRGAYVIDEGDEHEGTQRLRLLYALPERLREVKFQYYGEQFGHVRLPAPPAPPPPPILT